MKELNKDDLLAMAILSLIASAGTPPPATRSNIVGAAYVASTRRLETAMGSVALRGMNTTSREADRNAAMTAFMEGPNSIMERVTECVIAAAEELEAIAAGNETVDLTKMI